MSESNFPTPTVSGASRMEDVLYAVRINLTAGEAPGEHLLAFRSSANRALASKHVSQIVVAHNASDPGNVMSVISLTRVTPEELDQMIKDLRGSDPDRIDVEDIYPDEKDRGKLIAPKAADQSSDT